MTFRSNSRALAVALLAFTACSSGSDRLATEPGNGGAQAKGSSGAVAVNVAGTWSNTVPGGSSPSADSTHWSLFLSQNGDRLEGSLTRITYINGANFLGTSAIKKGFVAGSSISLEFDRGEGAETATTFSATVSDDRTSMTGTHSRFTGPVTLFRR